MSYPCRVPGVTILHKDCTSGQVLPIKPIASKSERGMAVLFR